MSEARKIDGGEISCQKGADEHGQEGEEKEPTGCQEEHASVLSNRLSPLSQRTMPKVPIAHSNALLEPNSRYEGRDAE